jgi:hypothetical protein
MEMPRLERVLPNIVASHVRSPRKNDLHTLHPRPEGRPGRGHVAALLQTLGFDDHRSAWSRDDRDYTGPSEVRSPARTFDKHIYSPWTGDDLHLQFRSA